MPPKKINAAKKEEKKIVEDKTFGMKNKKGKKAQTVLKQVQTSAQAKIFGGQKNVKQIEDEKERKRLQKEEEDKRKEELRKLFKPVVKQKVPEGADPKSVVCQYFLQGLCEKGDKCPFSHDRSKLRKGPKIDLYTDKREVTDTSANWDEDKLNAVVEIRLKEDGELDNSDKTDVVCKYFLDAVEKGLYGWFWQCPNGNKDCKFRHALPPGFALKKKDDKKEDKKEEEILEDLLDRRRAELTTAGTPVTMETFLAWKDRKKKKKEEEAAKALEQNLKEFNKGKNSLSGRELFEFKPDVFVDEEDAYDDKYERRASDDEDEDEDDDGEAGPSNPDGDDDENDVNETEEADDGETGEGDAEQQEDGEAGLSSNAANAFLDDDDDDE